MKAAFITLGCKLNYAETATWERAFIRAGVQIVPWQEQADIYVINTCSVTATADRKSRSEIRKVHRINPAALIAVTGCSAQLRRADIEAIDGVTHIFGASDKASLVSTMLTAAGHTTHLPQDAPTASDQDAPLPEHKDFFAAHSSGEDRTRAFLKVQDGCDNWCAYCTVPMARGRSRSTSICAVVRQATQIASSGVREIVLTGVNTGDFGRGTGETFLGLLQALEEVQGIERYRISSIEPNLITEEIIDWIAGGTKVAPHFHIPLQSGNDAILRAMGRRYTTAQFLDRINYIRRQMERPGGPRVFFGIDVMAGLPGETDEIFEQSVRFIEEVHPAYIHVFPYSKRPGTRAAQMPGQVSEDVKAERVKVLEALCKRLHNEFIESQRGLHERVIFESTPHEGMMQGYTSNYIRISRPWDPALIGRLTDVII